LTRTACGARDGAHHRRDTRNGGGHMLAALFAIEGDERFLRAGPLSAVMNDIPK
jgi:hypothetical protein